MFWKRKKEGTLKKLDKFLMGAIIGGAIGSVLGLTLGKNAKDKKNQADQADDIEGKSENDDIPKIE